MTIPELGAELRALRSELRSYVRRHDADHRRELRATAELRAEVDANTTARTRRDGQESVLRWLVGSNVTVLLALALAIAGLVLGRP